MTSTTQRSQIENHDALKPGHGTSRTWQRTIAGRDYSFTAVLMPDGERRYSASRLDGLDGRFDCCWHRTGWWTVPAPLGEHDCPCCGNATYGSGLLCSECRSADCQQTTDGSGETGWSDCLVQDDDDEYSEYSDVDGYDRNGAWDGFTVTSDSEGGL